MRTVAKRDPLVARSPAAPKLASTESSQPNPRWFRLATRHDSPATAPAPDGDADELPAMDEHTAMPLLRALAGAGNGEGDPGVVAAGVQGPGGPVPHARQLEVAFGLGLSNVRAHTGPRAKQACDAMGADAYALGSDLAFRRSSPGIAQVAHELAHAVQQAGGHAGGSSLDRAGAESQAQATAHAVESGAAVPVLGRIAAQPLHWGAIAAGQSIEVEVYAGIAGRDYELEEGISGRYTLDSAGEITFPRFFTIDMTGAPQAVAERLTARLADGYLRYPTSSVAMSSATSLSSPKTALTPSTRSRRAPRSRP